MQNNNRSETDQMKLEAAISTLENYPDDLNMISQSIDEIYNISHKLLETTVTTNRQLINVVKLLTKNIQDVEDNL
tara:strand:+ start:138 stop:362 length:225 start_codon:yes stop_codon:yes gene_type:complete